MKVIILTVFYVLLFLGVSAQILSISIDTLSVSGHTNEVEVHANATLNNLTTRNVTVRWVRTINNIPGAWTTSICDKNLCYLPTVSTQTFNLGPNESSNLDVRFYPANSAGNGEVHVIAYAEGPDSAASLVKGVYKGTIEEPVGITKSVANDNVKIYPNPVRDFILVKNLPSNAVSMIEVYNIFGRKMLTFLNPPNGGSGDSGISKLDVETLSKGIYMIRVYDSKMNVIHTKSISKE